MNKRTKSFLRGVGSVLDIWPTTDYSRFMPPPPEEQIRRSWESVGRSLSKAMGQFEHDQQQKKPQSS